MAFHEVLFPDAISRGARGGPERRTQIVELASGAEERNASWVNSRRRYDVAYGIRRADDLAAAVFQNPFPDGPAFLDDVNAANDFAFADDGLSARHLFQHV